MSRSVRFLVTGVAGALLFAPPQQAQTRAPQVFHAPARVDSTPAAMWARGVKRVRPVSVDTSLFDRLAAKHFNAGRQMGTTPYLRSEMNLFDDASLAVLWNSVSQTDDSRGIVWTGSLENYPLGYAVLVAAGDMVTANVSTADGRVFQLRTLDDGSQWVSEVDTLQLLPEGPTVPAADSSLFAALGGQAEADQPPADNADDGSVIDVMVLYTPAAAQKAGGVNAMQQQIQASVAEANLGYQNSNVVQRIRLVYSQQVQYTESGQSDVDLGHLKDPNDAVLGTAAHRLRDLYSADLVSLWVSPLNDACGLAADILQPGPPRPELGYNVVDYTCATTNLSFAHELGHLMGAAHDRDHTPPNSGAYAYSYGFVLMGVQRTVMAYPHPCECPRLNYWSNPGLTYNGNPLGIDQNAANGTANFLTLNNTRSIVAAYRTAQQQGGGNNGLPESDHPYANNLDKTYTYTLAGNPSALNVTFDPRTSVENGYDFIYISDGNGNQISGSPFTGTALANRTVVVPGATIKIRLVSDSFVNDFGFKVTSVTATGGGANLPKIVVTSLTAPTSATSGEKLQNLHLGISNQGTGAAGSFRVGFYFSQDRNVTTSSVFSGSSCKWDSFNAGSTGTCSGDIDVPNTLTPGTWYLGAIADDQNQLHQSDRSGNIRVADSGAITITGGVAADLQNPPPNSVLTSSSVLFRWSAGTGVSGYSLAIGTQEGGTDLFNRDMGTSLSVTVSSLPANGSTIFITLTSRIGSGKQQRSYTVSAASLPSGGNLPKLVVTAFSTPTDATVGANLQGISVTLENQGDGDAAGFRIGFYYSQNANVTTKDVFSGWYCNYAEGLGAHTSTSCTGDLGVPTTLRSGTWYVAAIADDLGKVQQSDSSGSVRTNDNGPLNVSGVAPGNIISPANGATFSSSSVLFRWDSGSGADEYWLRAGSSPGGNDLYDSSQGTNLSATVNGLPVDGRALYVSLLSRFGSDWYSNDYSYRAFNAGAGGALPRIVVTSFTAPSSGTIGVNLQGIRVVMVNQGNANAGPFRAAFYYSQKSTVTTHDIYSGWFCDLKNGLAAGATYTCTGEVGVPTSLSPGKWYVAVIADDQNKLQQSDRGGNTRVADTGVITLAAGNNGAGGPLPESDHPYPDNLDKNWTYVTPGNPAAIKVTFSSLTSVEDGYDFIYVYDSTGAQIPNSPFTGTQLAGKTVVVSGATVRIRLVSDDSVNDYGFKVTSIVDAGALPKLVVTAFSAPTKGTIGVNLQNMTVTVVNQGNATAAPFHIGFYYGKNQNVTPYDVDSGWSCTVDKGLDAGGSYKCGGEVGVPNALTPGTWYVAAIADDLFQVDQSDRRGNSRTNDNGPIVISAASDSIDVAVTANVGTTTSGVSHPRQR